MRGTDICNISEFNEILLDKAGYDQWGKYYGNDTKLFHYRIEWKVFCSVEGREVWKGMPEDICATSREHAMKLIKLFGVLRKSPCTENRFC